MNADSATPYRSMNQAFFLAGRLIVVFAAWVLLLSAYGEGDAAANILTFAGTMTATLTTLVMQLISSIRKIPYAAMISWIAPLDVLTGGMLVIGLQDARDPVYPVFLAITVFYSYLVHRREMWMLAAASGAVYLLAQLGIGFVSEWTDALILFLKSVAIVFVGVIAAFVSAKQEEYHRRIEHSHVENKKLNERLSRRISELQAVSQITEVIHSSLDFDRVGPLMLQILQKVIDIPSCSLMVIDKQKAETLFSASAGIAVSEGGAAPRTDRILDVPGDLDFGDSHLTCMSVLDHKHMMVVFCAEPEHLAELSAEDRMVLQAVSSELVVAVESSELYKLTRRLAITDDLTGLYNYRHLQQRLDEEIERARRYHKDVSLIMIDADDFKSFNDTHGHVAGDRALAELGSVIRRAVREVDLVARYGGEEFSVVLPETDATGAFVVAEKIREAVANHEFADAEGRPGPRLTVSLGLAAFPVHAEHKDMLLRQADEALYQAKNRDKNRVRSPRALDSDPGKEPR